MSTSSTNSGRIVFSGIRPTGRLHIGNYLGAIKNWLELQNKNQCIYAVVDYHGITTPFDSKTFHTDVYNVILDYLAAGLDPRKSLIIIQSQIPEHLELAWILGTITPVSWLERIPTYKEKAALHPKYVNLGLLAYPVLMAADILLYKATHVPVGQDQLPHIELTNEIARKFNNQFGKTFAEVQPILGKGAKILSLADPKKKMSKTGDEGIALNDPPKVIREKIKRAVTDSGTDIIYDLKTKPAISNLLLIYHLFSGKDVPTIEKRYRGKGYAAFKEELAEIVIEGLRSFRDRRAKLEKEKTYIKRVLDESREKARLIAAKTLKEVKEKIGVI